MRKAERDAARLQKRAAREAAQEEIVDARGRTAIGFGVSYVGTQLLPLLLPSVEPYRPVIDGGMALGGGYMAFTDYSETGDYSLGIAMVGATQTLDRVAASIAAWLAKP